MGLQANDHGVHSACKIQRNHLTSACSSRIDGPGTVDQPVSYYSLRRTKSYRQYETRPLEIPVKITRAPTIPRFQNDVDELPRLSSRAHLTMREPIFRGRVGRGRNLEILCGYVVRGHTTQSHRKRRSRPSNRPHL